MCLGLAAEMWLESPLGTPFTDSILLEIQAVQRQDYYVYIHFRASDNLPFYVGKGRGNRHLVKTGRNIYWSRVAKKHGYYSEIIHDGLNQRDAYSIETQTIRDLRLHGVALTNLTSGGDGGFGDESRKMTETAKRNHALSAKGAGKKRKGIKRPPHVVEKMRKAATGKRHSFSSRLKRSMLMRDELHRAYIDKEYDFINYENGDHIRDTMHNFCKTTGLPKGNVHRMIHGKLQSCGRWTIRGRDPSKIRPVNISRVFSHPEYGEVVCTMTELYKMYGAQPGNMANVIAGKRKTCNGWSYIGPSVAGSG